MGDIVGRIGPLGVVDEPHPASFPPDQFGRPNPTQFVQDMYEYVGGEYLAIIGPRDLRVSIGGRLPVIGSAINRIFGGPWAKDLHEAEVDRLKAPQEKDLEIAEAFLGYALLKLRVTESLGYTTRPNIVENFNPQTLTLNDLVEGGLDIHEMSDFYVSGDTTVRRIREAERGKRVRVSGVMESLLKHYDPETTLKQILIDLRRIQIRPVDLGNPQGHGYEFGFTAFNGVPVRGEAAMDEINLLNQPVTGLEIVSQTFVKHAEAVHQAAKAAGGRLVFSGTDGNPRYLVGTGLAGEVASEVVRAFFEGAGNVYMPGETIEESKLAAALVVKNSAMAHGVVDHEGNILVYGGELLVGGTNAFDAGRFVTTVQSILPRGAQAIYAAMMSGLATDDGYEVLAEAVQHGIAVNLAGKKLVSGFFRRLSPARAGKRVGEKFKNDIIYAQGLPYNVAQLMKVWSTEVLAKKYGLTGTSPTGPITLRKDPRDNHFIRKVADVAEEVDVYLARSPETTGSLAAIELVAAQLTENPETQSGDLAGAVSASFDGNVGSLRGKLNNRLVARAMPRAAVSQGPFKKPPGPKRENVRVNGPVLGLIRDREYKDISEIPDQVIATSIRPEDGFKPFTFKLSDGSINYVLWLNDPGNFPGVIGERMRERWNNSLGAILVINPERDTYIIIHHHGIREAPWSIYIQPGSPFPKHAIGRISTYANGQASPDDRAAILSAYNLAADQVYDAQLSADRQAELMLMGAVATVAGEAVEVTVKQTAMGQRLADIKGKDVALGGAAAIALTPPDDESRGYVMKMLQIVSEKTGAFIATEGANNGLIGEDGQKVLINGERVVSWMDLAATNRGNRFHVAGSENSHPLLAGHWNHQGITTEKLIHEGVSYYLDKLKKEPKSGIFLMETDGGGIGRMSAMMEGDSRNVVAVSDTSVGALLRAKELLDGAGRGNDVVLMFDAATARRLLSPEEFAAELRLAAARKFYIIDDQTGTSVSYNLPEGTHVYSLPAMILRMHQIHKKQIGLLVPSENRSPITVEDLDALKHAGGHAVIGAGKNMLAPDQNDVHMEVARYAQELGIFIPNNLVFNIIDDLSLVYHAVGLDQPAMDKLVGVVQRMIKEDYEDAYERGYAPFPYVDRFTKRAWDSLIDRGIARGGRFEFEGGVQGPGSPGDGGSGIRFRRTTGSIPLDSNFPSSGVRARESSVRAGTHFTRLAAGVEKRNRVQRSSVTQRERDEPFNAMDLMMMSNENFNVWLRERVKGDALVLLRRHRVGFNYQDRRLIITAYFSGSFKGFDRLVFTLAQAAYRRENPHIPFQITVGPAQGVPAPMGLPVGVGR